MVLLQSRPKSAGFSCPDFSLPSVLDDGIKSLKDFNGSKALLIAFICNHCPYVRAIEDRLIALKKSFSAKEFEIVGICSNDAKSYPDDSKEELRARWRLKNYGFPYLVDEDQSVAKEFDAVCTPDFYLFDENRKLFYRGELDDNWQDESKVTRHDLKEAILAILDGKNPPTVQKPSMGCSIKWHSED